MDTRVDRYRDATEVTIYTPDHPGLFSRIAGAMAVAGASIDAARIFTLKNGMALDSFYVRDAQGGSLDRSDKLARLSVAIEQTLSGRMRPLQELERQRSPIPSRLRVFEVQPRVLIDNKASARHTVIEVNGRDRTGLLYRLTLALSKLQLMIHSAKISTFGANAVDVFYVKDLFGLKVTHEGKLEEVKVRLIEAAKDPDAPQKAERKAPRRPARGRGTRRKSKERSAAAE